MHAKSIEAYSPRERVARYDRDMAIMHPNRAAMVGAVVGTLPFQPDARLHVLDLGIGSGILAQALLDAFPNARVTGIDGADAMLDCARERLAGYSDRVEYVAGDFRGLAAVLPADFKADAGVSSFALHHVEPEEKPAVLASVVNLLLPDGWLINADIVVADDAEIESRWQAMRVAGIVERAAGSGDDRFATAVSTRAYLDELEAREGDCPQTLNAELELLRGAGLRHAGVFWQNTREAVYGGFKAG
jgi:ubiquinone/menaquinone biosynthesis C-methylase UbiE